MIVWHVTTLKKLKKHIQSGCIKPPVRAWKSIESVPKFSIGTGRRVVLRLRFPDNATNLEGHHQDAVVLMEPFEFPVGGI